MEVRLSLYASLGKYLPTKEGCNPLIIKVENGTTIGDLLDQLNVPADVPKILFLNGAHSERNTLLNDGDEVGAFPPVAGG
jgi:molybdopterin converting factor small subunit